MEMSRTTSALILSLATGLTGLGTAIINRHTPNDMSVLESEKVSRRGYKVIREATTHVAEDVDILAKRIDVLEKTVTLQNNVIQFLMNNGLSRTARRRVKSSATELQLLEPPKSYKVKRVPTSVRGIVPSFEAAQRTN